jgi:hypothetical protein
LYTLIHSGSPAGVLNIVDAGLLPLFLILTEIENIISKPMKGVKIISFFQIIILSHRVNTRVALYLFRVAAQFDESVEETSVFILQVIFHLSP